MTTFDRAAQRVWENMHKKHNSIPWGLPRFEHYMPGIQQKKYYIFTANSGLGKTQITDSLFFYHPLEFMLLNSNIKIKWFYWSLEMDKLSKWNQMVSRYLFMNYGVRWDVDKIESVGDEKRMTREEYELYKEAKEYCDKLEDYIEIFHADPINPYGIVKTLETYALENGTIHYQKNEDGSFKLNKKGNKIFDYYEPNDPDMYIINITDHLAELNLEVEAGKGDDRRKLTQKETIEKHSNNMKYIRNRYGFTLVDVQQQAAYKEEQEYTKFGNSIQGKLEPSLDGLGESKVTQRKADIVLGLFAPDRFKIQEHAGYNITRMKDAYRNLKVLKNRNGQPNVRTALYFDGAVNFIKELPKADDMKESHYQKIENRQVKPNSENTDKQTA